MIPGTDFIADAVRVLFRVFLLPKKHPTRVQHAPDRHVLFVYSLIWEPDRSKSPHLTISCCCLLAASLGFMMIQHTKWQMASYC